MVKKMIWIQINAKSQSLLEESPLTRACQVWSTSVSVFVSYTVYRTTDGRTERSHKVCLVGAANNVLTNRDTDRDWIHVLQRVFIERRVWSLLDVVRLKNIATVAITHEPALIQLHWPIYSVSHSIEQAWQHLTHSATTFVITSMSGDHGFLVAASRAWNSLHTLVWTACVVNQFWFLTLLGFDLPCHSWSLLNLFWTGHGSCQAKVWQWGLGTSDAYRRGQRQTMTHIIDCCPDFRLESGLQRSHDADESGSSVVDKISTHKAKWNGPNGTITHHLLMTAKDIST